MPVQPYYDPRRRIGEPAISAFYEAFTGHRSKMNIQQIKSQLEDTSSEELADMLAQIREEMRYLEGDTAGITQEIVASAGDIAGKVATGELNYHAALVEGQFRLRAAEAEAAGKIETTGMTLNAEERAATQVTSGTMSHAAQAARVSRGDPGDQVSQYSARYEAALKDSAEAGTHPHIVAKFFYDEAVANNHHDAAALFKENIFGGDDPTAAINRRFPGTGRGATETALRSMRSGQPPNIADVTAVSDRALGNFGLGSGGQGGAQRGAPPYGRQRTEMDIDLTGDTPPPPARGTGGGGAGGGASRASRAAPPAGGMGRLTGSAIGTAHDTMDSMAKRLADLTAMEQRIEDRYFASLDKKSTTTPTNASINFMTQAPFTRAHKGQAAVDAFAAMDPQDRREMLIALEREARAGATGKGRSNIRRVRKLSDEGAASESPAYMYGTPPTSGGITQIANGGEGFYDWFSAEVTDITAALAGQQSDPEGARDAVSRLYAAVEFAKDTPAVYELMPDAWSDLSNVLGAGEAPSIDALLGDLAKIGSRSDVVATGIHDPHFSEIVEERLDDLLTEQTTPETFKEIQSFARLLRDVPDRLGGDLSAATVRAWETASATGDGRQLLATLKEIRNHSSALASQAQEIKTEEIYSRRSVKFDPSQQGQMVLDTGQNAARPADDSDLLVKDTGMRAPRAPDAPAPIAPPPTIAHRAIPTPGGPRVTPRTYNQAERIAAREQRRDAIAHLSPAQRPQERKRLRQEAKAAEARRLAAVSDAVAPPPVALPASGSAQVTPLDPAVVPGPLPTPAEVEAERQVRVDAEIAQAEADRAAAEDAAARPRTQLSDAGAAAVARLLDGGLTAAEAERMTAQSEAERMASAPTYRDRKIAEAQARLAQAAEEQAAGPRFPGDSFGSYAQNRDAYLDRLREAARKKAAEDEAAAAALGRSR